MTEPDLLRLKIEELKQRQAMAWRRIADPQITPSERREVRNLIKESGSALFNDNVQVKFNSGGMSLMLGNEEARDGRLQWRQDLSTQHAGPAAMARALLDPDRVSALVLRGYLAIRAPDLFHRSCGPIGGIGGCYP